MARTNGIITEKCVKTPKNSFYFEIFFVSVAALLLEVSYTRIISFKVYYFFTYLILGIALLGLGSGGVFVTLSSRIREAAIERLIPLMSFVGGLSVILGYLVVCYMEVSTLRVYEMPFEAVKLLGMSLSLYATFLCVGIVIATIFARNVGRVNSLYFVDLVGAGIACALAIPLFGIVTPPGAIFVAGAVLVFSGLRLSMTSSKPLFVSGIILIVVLGAGVVHPGYGIDPTVDVGKSMYSSQKIGVKPAYSAWSPVFRVDAYSVVFDGLEFKLLQHDGQAGSGIWGVKGDISDETRFLTDSRAIPFTMVQDAPEVLIIGAAGGHEILSSLFFGASKIVGVELNPSTYKALSEDFLEFTGHMVERPEVNYINAEGRSYMATESDTYDLIYYVAPDSYSAMNAATSGAFVLTESYLYTVEAIEESLKLLKDDGIICMEFGAFRYNLRPNRTSRYLSTAREAFRRAGIEDFEKHVLVGTTKGFLMLSTIILRKEPFEPSEIDAFNEVLSTIEGGETRVAWTMDFEDSIVNQIVNAPEDELQTALGEYKYDVGPVYDDSPFFWHFSRFRDLSFDRMREGAKVNDYEISYGEEILVALLVLTSVLGLLFLLLPFVFVHKKWRAMPYKSSSFVYFGILGLGFMFYEIGLIQKLTLFLGYPTYSLTYTLMSILLFSGVGSILSSRFLDRRDTLLIVILAVLFFYTLFVQFLLPVIVGASIGLPLLVRICMTLLIVAPLGLCLGAFLPIGLAIFASSTEFEREYVAWCWAVNGFFSVVGSVLATIVAMSVGFDILMLTALVLYVIAVLVIRRVGGIVAA